MDTNNPNQIEEVTSTPNAETKIQMASNRNLFKKSLYIAGGFVVILLAVLAFRYFGQNSAQKDFEQVQLQGMKIAPNDTASVEKYYQDLKKVADNGSYAANQNAKIQYATYLYAEKEDYKQAIAYLDGVSAKSAVVATGVESLKGDCYVNLGEYDKAIGCFEDALDEADENPELTPYVLNKLANVYGVTNKFDKQLEILEKIRKDYPTYSPTIDAQIARAKAAAGK